MILFRDEQPAEHSLPSLHMAITSIIAQHDSRCEFCAYHEAGHILFAYLCGYHCRHVELVSESNDEGFSSVAIIDYGKDSAMAARFMTGTEDSDYFQCLSLGEKLESIEVGRRLARILLGGSVAVAIFNNGGNAHIPLPIQIDYSDLRRADFIHQVIASISVDKEENFIEHGLQDAWYTLSNINIWNTVEDLARQLLKSNELDQNDIEECLEAHGVMIDEASPMEGRGHMESGI